MTYLESLDFGNIFALTQAGVPKKKDLCVGLIFENTDDGGFQLINVLIFAKKVYENSYAFTF